MAKAVKRKAPSKIKYDQNHPTISCRVPLEIYDRLQKVKLAEGKSFTDVLKVGLGILEVQVKGKEDIMKKGYSEGHRKGYAEAENLYKVTYPCKRCRQMMIVTSPDEKEAIKTYMLENGWCHRECSERGR